VFCYECADVEGETLVGPSVWAEGSSGGSGWGRFVLFVSRGKEAGWDVLELVVVCNGVG
jgi:hypothetical protein